MTWDEISLFTRRDSQRMERMWFISEPLRHRCQDGYNAKDARQVLLTLRRRISSESKKSAVQTRRGLPSPPSRKPSRTRLRSNKSDFYGHSAAVNELKLVLGKSAGFERRKKDLVKLSKDMDAPADTPTKRRNTTRRSRGRQQIRQRESDAWKSFATSPRSMFERAMPTPASRRRISNTGRLDQLNL